MNPKITPDHLARGAVVYVRQSTVTQVVENTESQRRQYALVEAAVPPASRLCRRSTTTWGARARD